MANKKAIDIVVFGATGFTGKFVVNALATTFKNEKITWAIAGRSKEKLNQVLTSVSNETNSNLNNVETIVASIDDPESLKNMCEKTKLVINCVGPYRFFGENVIKQCLLTGTHHLDISGEPEFLETMQLKYDVEAFDKNIFLIGSTGFDSIPAELGLVFTQNCFKNDLSYVESYLTLESEGPIKCNYGTYESAVYGVGSSNKLGSIRRSLFKTKIPKTNYPAPKKTNMFGFFYDDTLKKYCFNFLGSDKSVVNRTQYFNNEVLKKRPIQYMPYITINSFYKSFIFIIFGLTFGVLANFKFGRSLLLKYYKYFSFGLVTKEEDNPAVDMSKIKFTFQFRGVGWDNILDKDQKHTEAPNHLIVTELIGPEPGYIATSRFIISCALVCLQEKEKIPIKGGVLTPGAAFANTSLLERIKSWGIKLNVIYSGPKKDYKS